MSNRAGVGPLSAMRMTPSVVKQVCVVFRIDFTKFKMKNALSTWAPEMAIVSDLIIKSLRLGPTRPIGEEVGSVTKLSQNSRDDFDLAPKVHVCYQ